MKKEYKDYLNKFVYYYGDIMEYGMCGDTTSKRERFDDTQAILYSNIFENEYDEGDYPTTLDDKGKQEMFDTLSKEIKKMIK